MRSTFRAPRPLLDRFGPFRGMLTGAAETSSPEQSVTYAENMYSLDPLRGGEYVVRPPSVVMTGLPTGASGPAVNVTVFHQFDRQDGVSFTVAIAGGQLYVMSSGTTWTVAVDAATFATAGINLAAGEARWYALTFANRMIVSNGTSAPWMWDGATNGGLTILSNCPALYGQPVEYAGKLFGILASDRRTIVWSEENDPATGYETGFNNAWTIAQQGDEPLVRLLGRNDGLYYFRPHSVGKIAGAVAEDFRSTHTLDAVSTECGVLSPGAVTTAGDDIWFYDTNDRVFVMPGGGKPQDVSPIIAAADHEQPFEPADSLLRWHRASSAGNIADGFLSAATIGPCSTLPRQQVWFSVPGTVDNGVTIVLETVILAYDALTRLPQGVYFPASSDGDTSCSRLTSIRPLVGGTTEPLIVSTHVFTPTNGGARLWGASDLASKGGLNGERAYPGGPFLALIGRLVGPVLRGDGFTERRFLRADVTVRVPVTEFGVADRRTITYGLTLHTSQRPANTDTLEATAIEADRVQTRRLAYGLDGLGVWARPELTVRVAATSSSAHQAGIVAYTIESVPSGDAPYAP